MTHEPTTDLEADDSAATQSARAGGDTTPATTSYVASLTPGESDEAKRAIAIALDASLNRDGGQP
jgi:hypothetical protein